MGIVAFFQDLFHHDAAVHLHAEAPESYEVLQLKLDGQIRQLLSKFQLLLTRMYSFQYHYLNQVVNNHRVVGHEEIVEILQKSYTSINELTNMIQQDGFSLISLAKNLSQRIHSMRVQPKQEEALQHEIAALDRIIQMQGFFDQIYNLLSYCVSSMQEIRSRSKTRARLMLSDLIVQDATAIDRRFKRLVPMIRAANLALEEILQMRERYPSHDVEVAVDEELQMEKEDIKRLAPLLSHLYDKLYIAHLSLWSTSQGVHDFLIVLRQYIIPHIQLVIKYCSGIRKEVDMIEDSLAGTANDADRALDLQQQKIYDIAGQVLNIADSLYRTELPSLLEELQKDRPHHRRTEKAVEKLLAALSSTQEHMDHMKELMNASAQIEKIEELDHSLLA
ncbi:MAG: hypothetical protein ACOCWQ_04870 [Nanoarchaeota archaeon]